MSTGKRFVKRVTLAVTASLIGGSLAATAQAGDSNEPKQAELVEKVSQAELVMVGTLKKAEGIIADAMNPPTTTYLLTFNNAKVVRGELKNGTCKLEYRHTEGTPGKPVEGQRYLVLGKLDPENGKNSDDTDTKHTFGPMKQLNKAKGEATNLVKATDKRLKLVRNVTQLPVGWTLNEGGEPVSPWTRHDIGWPDPDSDPFEQVTRDAASGRPALTVPEGVELAVSQVIPDDTKKFRNPYGDGKFKVKVTNTTGKTLKVPALLQRNGNVLWKQSLFVITDGEPLLLPGTEKLKTQKVQPVTLTSGETVSTVVNLLPLDAVHWPDGGSRVSFDFCLGDRVKDSFFYYKSDYHDRLRRKVR